MNICPSDSVHDGLVQCGFALLEAGSVRMINTKNILLKNVLNTCLGALIWWAVGEHSFVLALWHGVSFPAGLQPAECA